jgi:hypothetical protein
MKRILHILFFILVIIFAFLSCQKDYSYETGTALGGTAGATLTDSLGNCKNITIKGTYKMDTVLTDSNYLKVILTVVTPGKYKIYSDTTNGFWFIDSGYALSTGSVTVKVKGYGKPILPQASNFILYLNSSLCTFTVAVNGVSVYTDNSDYFPNSIASNWTYYNNYISDTVRYTVSGYVGVVTGGNTYNIYVPSDTLNYGDNFYRKDGAGNYYEYTYLDDSATVPTDYAFLKDNVAQGTIWYSDSVSTTLNGKSTKLQYRLTIQAKNISVSINGTTYNNVIKVQTDQLYKINGTYTSLLSWYDYYAKGVGWIDEEYPTLSPPFSFTIKKFTIY